MNVGLEPPLWHDLFATFGTVCAALLGLYFVALSLRLRDLEDRPLLMYRGRSGLRGLLVGLMISLVVLIPGQPIALLGVELIAVEVSYVLIVSPAVSGMYRAPRTDVIASRVITVSSLIAIALVIVGGVSLILQQGPGLYLVVPWALAIILISSYFAWQVLFGAAPKRTERPPGALDSAG